MRALFAALLIILIAGPAAARSCAEAQRALAAAQGGGGGREAAALRQQAKAFGCTARSMFGRAPQCAGIEARLSRVSGGVDGRTVRRLQAEVNRACAAAPAREPQRVVQERRREAVNPRTPASGVIIHGTREDNQFDGRAQNGNFFSRLFGAEEEEVIVEPVRADPAARTTVERHSLDGERPRREAAPAEVRTLATGDGSKKLREGGYRTVCVRLCDGFYFPINSRSHSDNFYEELAMCVGRCPGADVSLYVHDANGAAEAMRSAMTGEPYVRLPTAFVYRKSLVPNCGCEPQTTIAADLTADKALSYVTAGGTGAAAVAEAAAAGGGWTPLKAVYDATGKPLDLSIGAQQVARAPALLPALATDATAAAPAPATPIAAGEVAPVGQTFVAAGEVAPVGQIPVAASSVSRTATPAVEIGRGAFPIRIVGGQFFSDDPTEAESAAAGLPWSPLPAAADVIQVVPLAPEGARAEPLPEDAAAEPLPETSAAPSPALPTPARTSAAEAEEPTAGG